MSADVVALATRDEAAHRAHSAAVERIRRLEQELEAAFDQLQRAQHTMEEIGVRAVVLFSKPVDAAWAAWRLDNFPEYSVKV